MPKAIRREDEIPFYEIEEVPDGNTQPLHDWLGAHAVIESDEDQLIGLKTLEGEVAINPGDYIVKDPMGAFTKMSQQEVMDQFKVLDPQP